MLKSERHKAILNQLDLEGTVIVKDLALVFDVTEDLIRKDLKELERKNLLKRVYGGATKNINYERSNVYERIDMNVEQKTIIAHKAYEQIESGDTIFLDISTTNLILAQLLAESSKKVIAVSNMIDALKILSTNRNITTIGTGGEVNSELNGFVGAITLHMINQYQFSKAFIGTTGIDRDSDMLTTFDMVDGLVKQAVIKQSKKTYVLLEEKKFSLSGNFRYSNLSNLDFVITNHYNEDIENYLKSQDIQCL